MDFASLASAQLQNLKQATIIYFAVFLFATGLNKTIIHLEVHNYMQCYVGRQGLPVQNSTRQRRQSKGAARAFYYIIK